MSNQQFIEKARAVHGDRYDYSLVQYQKNNIKVTIICPVHGQFEQIPSGHWSGKGCKQCGVEKRTEALTMTTEQFVDKAKEVHGNTYGYALVQYSTAHTKVDIICSVHGSFSQKPNNHINGQGCPKCGKQLSAEKRAMTADDFVERATNVHDGKYDYSKVRYVDRLTKVIVICPDHGLFEQIPLNHMYGHGCPNCSNNKKSSNELFIEQAKQLHGNKYDYSMVKYKNANAKIKIRCVEHGVFNQQPYQHLIGQGCPGCANTGFDSTKEGYVYLLRSECGRYAKIGISHKPKQRHVKLTRVTPFPFHVIECIKGAGSTCADVEREILNSFESAGFTESFDGSTEWRLWDDSIRHKLLTLMDEGHSHV